MSKYISSIDLSSITSVSHDRIMAELSEQGLLEGGEAFVLRLSEDDVETISDIFNDYHKQEINKFFGIVEDVKLQMDLFGGFAPAKSKKKEKSVAPVRTWESPDYLPDLEYCENYVYNLYTDFSQPFSEEILFDIEIYNNYFLIMFLGFRSGKCFYFEKRDAEPLDDYWIKWFVNNHTLISFNGIKFDLPLLQCALAGHDTQTLMQITNALIDDENGLRPYQIVKQYKGVKLDCDHIDLIEVIKGKASLKMYGARLCVPNVQDLPFPVGIDLSEQQISIVRRYCLNDVETTAYLYKFAMSIVTLRKEIGKRHGLDIRSKSDAQCAEKIIVTDCERKKGCKIYRIPQPDDLSLQYNIPSFINFKTDKMVKLLDAIRSERIVINNGKLYSDLLSNTVIDFGNAQVAMGTGGLHSREKSISWYAKNGFELIDSDASAFYPNVIVNQQLFPPALGKEFIPIYKSIIDRRIVAKQQGDKITDGALKIQINGSFGKFGSQYSPLYAPQLLIQTTITGQLALLMLLERLNLLEIPIVQVNTDGVVSYVHSSKKEEYLATVSQWELETGYNMEYTYYQSLHSRDVNSYFAVKSKGGVKRKGDYAEFEIDKNTANKVCTESVARWLEFGESIEDYILNCKDVTKFLTPIKVDGGAVKDTTYLGKVIRFYHSSSTETPIVRASNGNKVPDSDKCRPMMRLTKELPIDLDFGWYIEECYRILKDVGVRY